MITPREHVALGPRTTLELGGAARFFVEASSELEVLEALAWARGRGVSARVLGGGSNLVVPDDGVDGLVIAMASRGIAFADDGDHVEVTAAAGEPWDALVAQCIERGLRGLECLSGIPGSVGATPIQNVGAYGADVSQTFVRARAVERASGTIATLGPAALAFGYRDSALKRDPDRAVVLDVTFRLPRGGEPSITYAELARAMEGTLRTPANVRAKVIALRRGKSMVIDPEDPNRRSAGSFFTNPIVTRDVADEVVRRALAEGIATDAAAVPRWAEPDGRVKLAAGWLIERAGITKGLRRGPVGISSAHALALVHHGGGTTAALLVLAEEVRTAVHTRWGVWLEREPVLW